jgi:DNA-binding NarL/FixJ family response regulator
MMPISILVADDHPIIRSGVRALLETEPDFTVVAEAADGAETCALAERHQPDVLIVDLRMPGLGGMDVLRQVPRLSPATRVIVLSMHARAPYVAEALALGASGYVAKQGGPSDLAEAVRRVAAGQRYLSPLFAARRIYPDTATPPD